MDKTFNFIEKFKLNSIETFILPNLVIVILFLFVNAFIKSYVLQWFIWSFLFTYVCLFLKMRYLNDETFLPWTAGFIFALMIFLFPSSLFTSKLNKKKYAFISFTFASFILILMYIMIHTKYKSFFIDKNYSDILHNYLFPLIIIVLPAIIYWKLNLSNFPLITNNCPKCQEKKCPKCANSDVKTGFWV